MQPAKRTTDALTEILPIYFVPLNFLMIKFWKFQKFLRRNVITISENQLFWLLTWCQILVFLILGRIIILSLKFVQWFSENFSFTKLRSICYVSIISVMTHHNDVSTRRFRLWKGSSLIFFLWLYFFYVQLTIKQAWKIKKCPMRAS